MQTVPDKSPQKTWACCSCEFVENAIRSLLCWEFALELYLRFTEVFMKRIMCLMLGCMVSIAGLVRAAAEDKESAIKHDRSIYRGTWRAVSLQVDGKTAADQDTKKLTVTNRDGGLWSLLSDGKEISAGTSEIDPTKAPKTIDFVPSMGSDKGKLYLGIYALEGDHRKLCFASPGKPRPVEFASNPGSGVILVGFDREKK
jgi:uncharacterized protein (TIGR03067 family)